jgi:hypothetical protein
MANSSISDCCHSIRGRRCCGWHQQALNYLHASPLSIPWDRETLLCERQSRYWVMNRSESCYIVFGHMLGLDNRTLAVVWPFHHIPLHQYATIHCRIHFL